MLSGDVAERHARPERSAGAAVDLAQHCGHGIACSITARDGTAAPVDHLSVGVGLGSTGCAQRSRLPSVTR